MAALFQLVPVVPVGIAPVAFNGGFSPLGGDAMARLGGFNGAAGLDPGAGLFPGAGLDPTAGMLPGAGLNAGMLGDPTTALLEQLVGLLTSLMANQLMGPASGAASPMPMPSDSNGSSSADSSGGSGDVNSSSSASGTTDPSALAGSSSAGQTLAHAAEQEANAEHSVGYCYRGVGRALKSIGVNTSGEAAYMAADQLAQNPKVKEIHVQRSDLPKLPAGAIVVWAQGSGHPYGHISVALGDGREASDHVQQQIQDLGGNDSFRVFMPV